MLHGREGECAQLADLVAAARTGRSGALVLDGEAGIGKSALLEHAAELADGMQVLRGTGIETESELPFAGLHRLLRPLHLQGDLVDELPPPQRDALLGAFGEGPAVAGDRWLVSLAVLNLLAEAAAAAPVLCLVDDAQWLDSASADALTFVARRIHADGIALLFAARTDQSRPFEAPGLPRLHLAGLDAVATAYLLGERAHTRVAPTVRDRLLADTLGNPLALAELATALTPEQLDGSAPLPDRLPVGADVERHFGARVRAQPAAAQTLLLVAAVNDSGDLDTVLRAAETLGIGAESGAESLDTAEAAGLVRVDAGVLTFRHPLVRSAVYRGATSAARRAADRALAAALDASPDAEAHVDRRAWHLANAATGPDDAVAGQLIAVARRAADRGGHAAAAAAYARAAELTGGGDRRAELFVSAAEAAWLAGQPDVARGLLDRTRPATAQLALRGRVAHVRGAIETACGAPAVAFATLVDGADLITGTDPELAGLMMAEAGQIAWGTGDLDRIADVGARLTALPDTANPGVRAVLGLVSLMQGEATGAARELGAAAELAMDSDRPQMVLLAAAGSMFRGDDARALDLFTRAVARTRAAGAAATLPILLAPLATIELFTGRYGAATTDATEGLRLATETRQDNPAAHARSVLAWLAAVQGREADCTELADAALAHALGQRLGPHAALATWALAHLDLVSGRPDRAFERLQALAAAGPGEGNQMVSLFATADLVEAATRAGAGADAAPAVARLEGWATHVDAAWTHALVARCRAQLATDDDESDRFFTEALALHSRGGRPFDAARTALSFGERLRRRRRRGESRKHLRSALETFERLGAEAWARHARAELKATGETARTRDVSTLAQLTPQELQITRLVAGGATNRLVATQLFLSPRTVDYHLRKVFAKLGVSSRNELVRLALQDETFTAR